MFDRLTGYATVGSKRVFQRLYGAYVSQLRQPDAEDVRDVLQSVEGYPSIYFLCFGNICRSPFAERYLRRQLDSSAVGIESGGFYYETGRSCPETAKEVATEFTVELTDHHSHRVTRTDLQRSDLVFVMDYQNLLELRYRFRNIETPVFPLGVLTDTERLQIADPYGGDAETFRGTYREISAAVGRLAQMVEASKQTDRGG